MKQSLKRLNAAIVLIFMIGNLAPREIVHASSDIIYPLKEISKLDCRFDDFENLSSNCKQDLPILKSKDYEKYATKNSGYNDYTRLYTVLWGASYKYGWDVGNGGHQGTDIATAKGTPVYAIADGKVITSSTDIGWGKHVSIEHTIDGKKVVSNYAHLSKILVEKGDKVKVGDEIGKVGSTGNSTGNHLHFQIDLPSSFHPYYYDWNACPYSYYQITEQGVCFDELAKNTIDPLVFLETNGGALSERTTSTVIKTSSSTTTTSGNSSSYIEISDIFDTTIYYGYGTKSDVKALQRLMEELGYYDGKITGEFKDIEKSVLKFQLETGVISSKNDDGAGWFGPKTRAQAKEEYSKISNETEKRRIGFDEEDSEDPVEVIQKVSRTKLMTREEIEAKETAEFLEKYNPELQESVSQIKVGEVKLSHFTILNEKGNNFKGNTPGKISFDYDSSKITIFPSSFYNFTGEPREIYITGLSEGNTSVGIKMGDILLETLSITIGAKGKASYVKSADIYTNTSTTLGEVTKAVAVLKDQYGNKYVKSPYSGNFTLQSKDNILYCIKKGSIADAKKLYTRDCYPEEYSETLSFSYQDTVGWVLIFEYKVLDSNATLALTQNKTVLWEKSVAVSIIKKLDTDHPYFQSIIDGVMSGVVSGIERGYFEADKTLSQQDAKTWILAAMEQGNYPEKEKNMLRYARMSRFTKMSRNDFLEMSNEYLSNSQTGTTAANFKDLDTGQGTKLALLVGQDYKWNDAFGEEYFQPDKEISRWEAAYMLMQALKEQSTWYLVRN
jgi:hypothetical protein